LPAKWVSNSSDLPRQVTDVLENALGSLARPAVARRLRRLLIALFAVWGVFALSQFIWALLPAQEAELPANAVVINPANVATPSTGTAAPVDIERLQSWHLFGEAGEVSAAELVAELEQAAELSARDGIEKGARETRLALKLRGVVASSEDGRGYAIIEHQSKQDIYAVDDKLPLPGRVVLAKVMAGQVVLDNGGTYELLELFEESALDSQLLQPPAEARAPTRPSRRLAQERGDSPSSAVARSYRDRLYQNPQSLADVVTVSAVRENGELLGYRLAPGKEQEQFAQLGFKPGDMVTSVNGIALNDPANTLRLYQTMRSASEAVFDLQRDDQPLTISVSLGDTEQ
jgi:general secretion pathway protein C